MSVRRYQIACAVLAATTVASLVTAHRGGAAAPGLRPASSSEGRAAVDRVRRPVRVSAAALGLSEHALIDRLLAARTAREVAVVCEKLAVVGTDDAVAALAPLVDDPRAGVAEAVLAALGRIGTRRAADLLLALADDPRPRVRLAAIGALGPLADERAVPALIAIADERGDPARYSAIAALGEQGGEAAMTHLATLARAGELNVATAAVAALSAIPEAQATLLALTTVPDVRVRVAALGALEPTTPEVVKRLLAVVAAGELQTSQAAIGALGKSGDPTVVPALARAAREGNPNLRWSAIAALGELGGDEAVGALGELLAHSELDVVSQIALTLANLGGDEARAALIGAALEGGRRGSMVLGALGQLRGDDVDAALLAIAQGGSAQARRDALPILVRNGVPEAIGLAADLIKDGGRQDRLAAIAMLGDSAAPEARLRLLDLAEHERGPIRTAALEALSQTRPDDPQLAALLGDALLAGRPDEVATAASILGRVGTDEARALLVAAIGDDDVGRAQAAIGALGYGVAIDGELRAALARAATNGPAQLRAQATQQLLAAGGTEGLSAARTLVTSGDPEAARQAVWALSSAGGDGARDVLREAARSTDASVRVTAAQVLAQRPDEADAALLIQLARDPDPSVKAQALASLGQVGTREAIDSLVTTATSAGRDDRIAALGGLSMADDPRASQILARAIEDGDPGVATAAMYASGLGGDEIDQALLRAFRAAPPDDGRRYAAATQLRNRGVSVDDATARQLDELLGAQYGGAMYGGYSPYYEE